MNVRRIPGSEIETLQPLAFAKGVICLITNNQSGTNNWIDLEISAAIGGQKDRLIIIASRINVPLELSRPLQELQYLVWSDRVGVRRELKRAKLSTSPKAVEDIVAALEPPKIRNCIYGVEPNWYTYSNLERGRFATLLENRKELVIGNHLIDNRDPSPGNPKFLKIEVERAGQRYIKLFEEGVMLHRSDLW